MKSERAIRFFPDWGRKDPLWDEYADDCAVRSSDLDISSDLKTDLGRYMSFWHDHFHEESEWDSESAKVRFSHEGDRLIKKLQEELGSSVVIVDKRDQYSRME